MKNLTLHIQYLQRRHECVIVPGLGAIITRRCPAEINIAAGTITPPAERVSFNASIRNNDGLLANSIARRDGISYSAALGQIQTAVAEIHALLASGRQADLGTLGTLTLTDDATLLFTPARTAAAPLGRMPIALPARRPETSVAEIEATTESIGKDSRYYYLRLRKRAVHAAAAVVAIAAIGISALLIPGAADGPQTDRASVVPVETIERTVSQIAKPAPKQPAVQPVQQPEAKRYHLIVGTFKSKTEMEQFLALYKDTPWQLTVLPGKKVMRVAVKSADNTAELVTAMADEQIKKAFPAPWIWEDPTKK